MNLFPGKPKKTQPDPFWGIHNMTDSPLAILQAANLYVKTMNNPIRWIDPSGLMALDPTTQALLDRFIATEYGGRVNASEYALAQGATVTNLNGGGINISHNGISQNFHLNNNGMLSINALNSIFNWNAGFGIRAYSERQEIISGSMPIAIYTPFLTLNNAALAWRMIYHPLSGPTTRFPQGSEFAAWLYRNPQGLYLFGSHRQSEISGGAVRPPRPRTDVNTLVGLIHTHPWPENGRMGEHFSYADGRYSASRGVWGYVITSNGNVRGLCPTWPTVIGDGAIPNDSIYVSLIFRNTFLIGR